MCGIVGYISLRDEPVDPAYLKPMADAQRHRGPDAAGEYWDRSIAMGSQRLAIIDLQRGDQPIYNEDRSVVIVYNGELYNYRELRSLLEDTGHRFATATDTEVLVHAYEEMGLGFFSRLNGMFAFALWDRRSRRLVLGRDPLGMKPLYWAEKGGTLWFASEVKSLLALPHFRAELDPAALSEFLLYQNLLAERSFFRGIRKLKAGHYLVVEGGRGSERQYWDVPFDKPDNGRLEDHLERYQAILKASIDRHLLADVEVGSYVSGGYDSPAVALLAAQRLPGGLHTFIGAFPGQGNFYDERPAARAVARRCGPQLHEVPIDAGAFWDALEAVSYAMDEPSVGCAAIPQYLVAQEVARHVKVVLTGHGGDELFLGYEAYKAVYLRQLLREAPWQLPALLRSVRPSEVPRLAYFGFSTDPVVRSGLLCLFTRAEIPSLLAPGIRAQLQDHDPLASLRKVLDPVRDAPPVDQTIYLYLKTYLPTLLVQEDKVGMAHSVESRMPLCDRELVEFMVSVPASQKLYRGRLKYFPKAGLRGLYPPEILRQPKRGFPTPIARWFRGSLRRDVEQRLFGPASQAGDILDVARVRELWRRFLLVPGRGLASYYLANRLYSLLSAVVSYEVFVCGRSASARQAIAGNAARSRPRAGSEPCR